MKTLILSASVVLVIAISSASTCNRPVSNNAGLPLCMQQKANDILAEPVRNPPAKIYSYQFQGQKVYFIPAHHGDFFSELYTSSCSLICHPDGGFTGMGDGNCPTFFTNRSNQILEWEDPR